MNISLKGERALVTGATAGIGKAIAETLAAAGAEVIVVGTHAERGAAVVEGIVAKGGKGQSLALNVASYPAVETALKDLGEISILINNAGITRDGLLMKMSEADWDDVMNVNVKSCFNLCRALVRAFIKARKGKIINISSIVGLVGNPGQANYAASKGAMIAFTKALALELASRNIQVNCIAPGFIETAMTATLTPAQKEAALAQIPLGRMGSPQDIANLALYLSSPVSDYITGQVMAVDGGMVT